jgi:hypothetical protein
VAVVTQAGTHEPPDETSASVETSQKTPEEILQSKEQERAQRKLGQDAVPDLVRPFLSSKNSELYKRENGLECSSRRAIWRVHTNSGLSLGEGSCPLPHVCWNSFFLKSFMASCA